MSNPHGHFFISYSRRDSEQVERLVADLKAAGIPVWIDRTGLKAGTQDWEDAIRTAIAGARGLLFMASEQARTSDYVHSELELARARRITIIPVWISGEEVTEVLPMGYFRHQLVDVRGEQYAAGMRALIAELSDGQIAPPADPAPPVHFVPRNPYKGLKAFIESDRADFHGRARDVKAMLGALRAYPAFLAVVGASGSGKSSALRAGVLPRLREGQAVPGSDTWTFLDRLLPGEHPIENLTVAFTRAFPQISQTAVDDALHHPARRGLIRLAKQVVPDGRLLLFIDQFEEVFAPTVSADERRLLIDLIITAAQETNSPVCVVIALRADFYDRVLAFPELGRLIAGHSHVMTAMELPDLIQVARLPAEADDVRLTFEPGLIEDMVYSVRGQPGALPLLQFTLDRLFQQREGHNLTRAAYDALGGVQGALRGWVEDVYTGLTEADRELARTLFLRLITPGDADQPPTRRRARMSELDGEDADDNARLRRVVAKFIDARLLSSGEAAGEATVEISHEALIAEWDRLRGWIDSAGGEIRLQARISADAAEWTRRARSDDLVYRGERLEEAKSWLRRARASVEERAFVEAGVMAQARTIAEEMRRRAELDAAAHRARRAQRGLAIAGVIAIVLMAFGAVSAISLVNTTRERDAVSAQVEEARAELTAVEARIERINADFASIGARLSDVEIARAFCVVGILTSLVDTSRTVVICDRMVRLSHPRDRDFYRDFRGIALAIAGDMGGALSDFQAARAHYVRYVPGCSEVIGLRDAWISQLEAGENPFAEETRAAALETWRSEPNVNTC
jgi:hypothetical protein